MKNKYITAFLRTISITITIILLAGCFIAQPTLRKHNLSSFHIDETRLRNHVNALCHELHPRDWSHTNNLDACASYIAEEFRKAGAAPQYQNYIVDGMEYRNVIGRFNKGKGSKIIIGAHYDSCGEKPGADDNASGVAGLIELAYLFGDELPDREIELVAYTLEEPPFFSSQQMGSAVHASGSAAQKNDIEGVIVLEMIGYFNDGRRTQFFPFKLLRLFYPDRGNFIAVIGRWDQGDWIKKVKAGMKGTTSLPVYSLRAPASVQGIDFSDHRNYWPYGINAVMITDTSFYRNQNYHTDEDTPDSLDYTRMGKVVISVYEMVLNLH